MSKTRPYTVSVRLTPKEYRGLVRLATKADDSLATHLRALVVSVIFRDRMARKSMREMKGV